LDGIFYHQEWLVVARDYRLTQRGFWHFLTVALGWRAKPDYDYLAFKRAATKPAVDKG